ncbi:MAG: His/Gly/Thr/Pro-type tRNA ligase C-terminal domain-containing protein, partial [archaeon]
YYTGNIFEVKIEGEKNTISGGGRYDDMVGKYVGRKIPAVGISFGLERLCQFAKIKVEGTRAILISMQQDKITQKLAKTLRANEITCLTNSGKVGKALEYANSYAIPFAIFIGEMEVEKGKFKLKNMKSGEEKYLTEKQLIATLLKED